MQGSALLQDSTPGLKQHPKQKDAVARFAGQRRLFVVPFAQGGEEKLCTVWEGQYPGGALSCLCPGAPLSQWAPVLTCPCSGVSLSRWAPTTASPCPGAFVPAYLRLNMPSFQCAFVPVYACFGMGLTLPLLLPRCKPVTGMPLFWRASAWVRSCPGIPLSRRVPIPVSICFGVFLSRGVLIPVCICPDARLLQHELYSNAPPSPVQACHRHAPVLACFCLGAFLSWHAPILARPHSSAHLFRRIPISTRLCLGGAFASACPPPTRLCPSVLQPRCTLASMFSCFGVPMS